MENLEKIANDMDNHVKAALMMMAISNPEKVEMCEKLMILNDIGTKATNLVDAFNDSGYDKPMLIAKLNEITALTNELKARVNNDNK